MPSAMNLLISRKFYASAEVAQKKLDVFFMVNRLTDVQYTELSALVAEVYRVEQ